MMKNKAYSNGQKTFEQVGEYQESFTNGNLMKSK